MPRPGELENFQRLEQLVHALVARFQSLQGESSSVREQLEQREERIRDLEEQLLTLNQIRRDAGKRMDDLIAQLDHLDSRLGRVDDQGSSSGGE